jgi:hypothetical protein
MKSVLTISRSDSAPSDPLVSVTITPPLPVRVPRLPRAVRRTTPSASLRIQPPIYLHPNILPTIQGSPNPSTAELQRNSFPSWCDIESSGAHTQLTPSSPSKFRSSISPLLSPSSPYAYNFPPNQSRFSTSDCNHTPQLPDVRKPNRRFSARLFFILGFFCGPWSWVIGGWLLQSDGSFFRSPSAANLSEKENSRTWIRRCKVAAVLSGLLIISGFWVGIGVVVKER